MWDKIDKTLAGACSFCMAGFLVTMLAKADIQQCAGFALVALASGFMLAAKNG